MIGDELGLEVQMGRAAGAATAVVRTGMTRIEHVDALPPGQRPDAVLTSLTWCPC